MRFRPTEVLLSPTAACNLSCAHCVTPKTLTKLPVKTAGSFLLQCKNSGIKRVSFTGGEPFLAPDFLYHIVKLAVREGLLFGRIMTNGVWYKTPAELKKVLLKLFESGYDGDICVSVDAFHKQDLAKVAGFIKSAVSIWRRPDIVSVVWTGGSREKETKAKLKKLLTMTRGIPIRTFRIDLSPVGKVSSLKYPWGKRWFKDDYCKGPGNVLYVLAKGDVKPCCGYATDHSALTIGNIKKDSVAKIIRNAADNDLVRSVFSVGLGGIRKRLERLGIRFPGKTENHCFFCHYILTKVPRNVFLKAIRSARLTIIGILLSLALCSHSFASDAVLKKSVDYRGLTVKIIRQIILPEGYHEGILIDGDLILVANGENGNIWSVNAASGEMVGEIAPPAGFTEAIVKTKDGRYLTTDWDDKKLYEVTLNGDKANILRTLYDFSPAHPAGLVSMGERIFAILWTRGLGTKFDLLELDRELRPVARIAVKDIQEPAHMAWDGKNLWITGWYNRRVYKVDPENWKVTGSFRAPFNKVTGIAWDGRYLWITGTYADLYQISVD